MSPQVACHNHQEQDRSEAARRLLRTSAGCAGSKQSELLSLLTLSALLPDAQLAKTETEFRASMLTTQVTVPLAVTPLRNNGAS